MPAYLSLFWSTAYSFMTSETSPSPPARAGECFLCLSYACFGYLLHAPGRCRSCVRDGAGGGLQILDLLSLAPAPALVCSQRHAHGRRRVRTGALCHHVTYRFSDFLMGPALHLYHLNRIDAPVQYPDHAVLIPGDILIAEHPCEPFVLSFHFRPAFYFAASAFAASCAALYFSASSSSRTRYATFPTRVLGSSLRNSISYGIAYFAMCFFA